MYNNIWSIPSDTHMHLDNTGIRYITSHMVGITERWDKFVCACNWGAINFRTTGYWSLCNFLQTHGLRGEYGNLNGDNVYMVTPIAEVPGSPVCCPTCCTTTESQMPAQISTLTTDNNPSRVKECYKGKSNLYEVCEAMNENVYVKDCLGDMYDDGKWVEASLDEAIKWYKKAEVKKHPGAYLQLARIYFYGDGIKKDLKKSFQYPPQFYQQ